MWSKLPRFSITTNTTTNTNTVLIGEWIPCFRRRRGGGRETLAASAVPLCAPCPPWTPCCCAVRALTLPSPPRRSRPGRPRASAPGAWERAPADHGPVAERGGEPVSRRVPDARGARHGKAYSIAGSVFYYLVSCLEYDM
jgi:hypothetical protein